MPKYRLSFSGPRYDVKFCNIQTIKYRLRTILNIEGYAQSCNLHKIRPVAKSSTLKCYDAEYHVINNDKDVKQY